MACAGYEPEGLSRSRDRGDSAAAANHCFPPAHFNTGCTDGLSSSMHVRDAPLTRSRTTRQSGRTSNTCGKDFKEVPKPRDFNTAPGADGSNTPSCNRVREPGVGRGGDERLRRGLGSAPRSRLFGVWAAPRSATGAIARTASGSPQSAADSAHPPLDPRLPGAAGAGQSRYP